MSASAIGAAADASSPVGTSATPALVRREIADLALPAVVGTLIEPLLSLIDMTFIGRGLGAVCHGAIGPASEIFTLAAALMWAIKDSTATSVARLHALGDTRGAVRYLEVTVALAIMLGVALAALVQLSARSALAVLGAPASSPLHAPALTYVRVRACALPCVLFGTAAEGAFRGLGDTRTPLRASATAALVNLVLDPLLMFGPVGLGMAGAAAATAVAQCASAGVYALALHRRTVELGVPMRVLEQLRRVRSVVAEARHVVASNGVLLVRTVSILSFWVFCSALATRLGPASAAAHFTMINLWLIFVLSAEAPGVAAQVLSARAVATGRRAYAGLLLRELATIAVCLGALATGAVLAAGPFLVTAFTRDAEIASLIGQLLLPVALSFPLVVLSIAFEAMLIGAGFARFVAASSLCVSLASSAIAATAFSGGHGSVVTLWWAIQAMFVGRVACALSRVPAVLRAARGGAPAAA